MEVVFVLMELNFTSAVNFCFLSKIDKRYIIKCLIHTVLPRQLVEIQILTFLYIRDQTIYFLIIESITNQSSYSNTVNWLLIGHSGGVSLMEIRTFIHTLIFRHGKNLK